MRARFFHCCLLGLLFAGLLCGIGARAADLPLNQMSYQTWSTEGGLPQISVHAMVEDGEGLLWIGTEKGLARFDGSRFDVFDRSNTPKLASSWITRLLRDRRDRIWIANLRNLVRWEQGKFIEQPLGTLSPGMIVDLAEDATGRIWVAGDSLLAESKGAMAPVPGWEGRPQALLADGPSVWVAAQGGVLAEFKNGHWTRRSHAALAGLTVASLAKTHGAIWIATNRGLFKYENEEVQPVVLRKGTPPKVTALSLDGKGRLLVATDATIYRIGANGEIEGCDTTATGFAGIISLFTGRDGSLWIGSYQQGLRHVFEGRARSLGTLEGLRDLRTWSVLPTPDGVVVGHNAGYDRLRDGRFEPLVGADALPETSGYSAFQDARGQLWFGTRGALARREADGSLTNFPQFNGKQINGMLQDRSGLIWVASGGGLFTIDDNDQVRDIGEGRGLDEKMVRSLMFDSVGALWVGTERGLFRQRGKRFERVNQLGLGQVFVSTMLQLSDGRIVVGTYDDGMYIQDGDGWKLLDKAAGLPSMSVFFMAEYRGYLVVSSSEGAYRVPIATLARSEPAVRDLEVLLLDQGERLGKSRVRCCNGAGMGKGAIAGDTLMLPTLSGLAIVPLHGERESLPVVRQLVLTTSEGSQSSGVLDAGMHLSPITLPQGVRDMEIGFSVIDFRRANALAYRYRLVDFDRDWIEAGLQNKGVYNHLPPGRWKLEVQARHLYEPWGPSTLVEIVVPARFVEGATFRALVLLLGLAALMALIRLRERRLLRQKKELETLVAERTADLERTNRTLAEASVTDTLTGLHNRRFLQDQIDVLVAGTMRARQDQAADIVLGLALIDIDHFKAVNDTWGHAVGDQVLCRVADALRSVGRASDILVRWGGEEFLVVLQGTHRDELLGIGERLREAVAHSPAKPGEPGRITASVGIVGFPLEHNTGQDWHTALALADKALYAVKESGRNRVATLHLSDPDLASLSGRQLIEQLGALQAAGRVRLEFASSKAF
ncbi:ligand-binding sensor domain-containing diguanylate cyclase [Massilia sp. TS11]|uniref:ligand-binding sensor domain-containing diguanylate cyclase n=1 Tax=Massilia sp. TS11 TaxID=2908003 RepID=UPI001EDB3C21|nr:ligand-binding sensor domain-containing diguanylate cyclase [Massilia sp. TS11]MCG2584645.1 diguanylate cyclase [Massilia sp. TS11]